jgi:3-isopropylmalate/(R)-2-methylmalate dehydratase small subunit
MKKITHITGKAIPLMMDDVDTDLIIPAQHLTSTARTGYGQYLFERLRVANPEFVFNQTQFAGANILITQHNFGCGSSREHAVWTLQEAGIQAVLAISFADIFFNNSAKNGLVLITLPEAIIHTMLEAAKSGNYELKIDIANQTVASAEGSHHFDFDPFRKYCLLNGLDDLDYLLHHQAEIAAYQDKHKDVDFITQ